MTIKDVFAWNEDKNALLLSERGLSFDEVVFAIEEGRVLDDFPHPNAQRFARQRVLVVEIGGYACAVPYVVQNGVRFFKTIYRSRVLHQVYLAGKEP